MILNYCYLLLTVEKSLFCLHVILYGYSAHIQVFSVRVFVLMRFVTMFFCVLLQTKVLTAIFSLPHGDFLSSWCSSNLPMREEDGSLEYDSFAAAGWVLDKLSSLDLSNGTNLEFSSLPNNMPQTSYEHQRTSLFVKVIANLHCFVPTICEGWFSINDYVNFMTSLISSQQFFLIILIKFSILIHRAGEEPLPSQVFGVLANGPIKIITWIFH